ncbi:MAG: diacylglycerol/polyprenol kinase family protein [Nanobdellota archaeon]
MKPEYLRKIIHILVGVLLVFLFKFYWFNIIFLPIALFLICVVDLSFRLKIPLFTKIIKKLDTNKKCFKKSTINYLFGIILTYILFRSQPDIFSASVVLLAMGDGMAGLIGKSLGKHPLFFNKKKSYEGLFSFILFSSLSASLFVPLIPAILTSIIVSLLEATTFKIRSVKIDDNLYIPALSGIILSIIL